MRRTAFVSHYDCSRHDTGWQHPDHQGRLPALMRAVHADMLTLFDHLLEVEGRHATREELLLLHTPDYLDRLHGWVEEATNRGSVIEPIPGVRVSGATWDAATAAVGCTLTAVDRVLDGEVDGAFCAVRPPGRYVTRSEPGGFGVLNTVATCASYAARCGRDEAPEEGSPGVLVLELCGPAGSPTADLLPEGVARVCGVYRSSSPGVISLGSGTGIVPPGVGRVAVEEALESVLADACRESRFDALILSIGFDGLEGDPLGDLGLRPLDFYHLTRRVRTFADDHCAGRLVSILEGGYEARGLGTAAVQHLRGLVGVDPIA